ncbi:MAG: thiamine-phosphate synthase family protein [Thermoproteus sp. AZ2]|uniref:Thiamine-phosphate synthase family protein n=1 Tax=Thermoproteus sp. AZ2 TaxID=1609232 RepID=A0ACC6V0D5_9CREN|nr:MAG: transcriptional regulator [Thermoproteus sp. AZ2]
MFPLELVADRVIQPLKGLLAHRLAAKGLSQSRIGQILGISQPAVSAYLKAGEEYYVERLRGVGISEEEVERILGVVLAAIAIDDYTSAIEYINTFSLTLLSSLRLCEIHRSIAPYLKDCDVCKYISIYNESVNRVKIAYNILRKNKNIIKLVPRVLMNIVELSKEGPVGFPGRLTVIGDALQAGADPQLWGARFLGNLILKINEYNNKIKAIINIKYDKNIIDCVRKNNFKYIEVGPSNSEEESVTNISKPFASHAYDVVFDRGGVGIEPNGYVVGADAAEAAIKVSKIADCLA